MTTAPTHWTDFDKLYNLPDPRPYFRGVETGDYRMPGVMALALAQLIPTLAEGREDPVRLIDFAAGYGAVGLCLRTGQGMAALYDYFRHDAPVAQDAERFMTLRAEDGGPGSHRIDAIDIADRALDYARSCGAIDAGHTDNLVLGPPGPSLRQALRAVDLVYECGAIGDHVSTAMSALLAAAAPNRPILLLSPRPRVDLAPLQAALAAHDYGVKTAVPGIRYRRAFSPNEMREELAAGIRNGYAAEECTVGDYFRVDLRLAVPRERNSDPLLQALSGLEHDTL